MTEVTVERGDTSVTFDIYERAGNLMVARDVGHPEARVYRVGKGDPRAAAHRSPLESFTITGQRVGDGAYEDARALAEDIVKPHSGGEVATLDLSDVSGLGSYTVEFRGDGPLKLHYPPGQGEWVSIQLQASVVDNVIGGSERGELGDGPVSGDGPVTLARGPHSVLFSEANLDVLRDVGRPDTTLRHNTGTDPYAVDRPRASSDVFELSGLWTTDAENRVENLVNRIVKPKLGYRTLRLNFNGKYGLGRYNVFPVDTRSCRVSWSAGETGMVRVDTLTLTVVREN